MSTKTEASPNAQPKTPTTTVVRTLNEEADDEAAKSKTSILKNVKSVDQKPETKNRRHTIYEVTNIPALQSKIVPITEKVNVFKRLKYQDDIKVRQYFEDMHDIVGFGLSNTYAVTILNRLSFDPTEETILYFIGEKISCEGTWLKTSGRALNFRIYNPDGDAIGFISRPCSPAFCFSNLCPCCARNTLYVSLADGRRFGKVKKTFSFSKPVFSIYDSEDTKILQLSGAELGHIFPCWQVQPSRFMSQAESTAAFIQKQNTGPCVENTYVLNVEHMMDVKSKMLLVSMIILIDFQHFRRCATLCHFLVFFFWVFGFFAAVCVLFYFFVVKDKP